METFSILSLTTNTFTKTRKEGFHYFYPKSIYCLLVSIKNIQSIKNKTVIKQTCFI